MWKRWFRKLFVGGIAWETSEGLLMQVVHPLLMVIKFILISGEAILASAIFGIWTKFHGTEGVVANFYSLHSWMGLKSTPGDEQETIFSLHGVTQNKSATLEQHKSDDRILKLVDDQKREIKKLHHQIMELHKKVDGKQCLELEMKQMKATMEVIKHMINEDIEANKKTKSSKEDLKEKEKELEDLEELHQAMIVYQRLSNDEKQDARKELISALEDQPVRGRNANIGVKRRSTSTWAQNFVCKLNRHLSRLEHI